MAKDKSEGEPIAIVGSGHAGMAAIINTFVDIASNAPEDAPPVTVVLLDTRDEALPKGDTAYPLRGTSLRNLHPFDTDEPPVAFPTSGEYIEQMSEADPSLRSALLTPTYRQVDEYIQFVLELAIITVADKTLLDVNKTAIRDIRQTTQNGPPRLPSPMARASM